MLLEVSLYSCYGSDATAQKVWNDAIFFQLILKPCNIEDQTKFDENQQRSIREAFSFSAERNNLVS